MERDVPRHAVAFSEGGSTRCQSNCSFAGWYSRLRGFFAIGPSLTRILKSPRYVEARGVIARGRRGDARPGRQALPWLEQRNYAMTTTHQSLITHHRGFRVEGVALGDRAALDGGRGVILGVAVGVGLAVAVGAAEGVTDGVGVAVGVLLGVGVGGGVAVGVTVGVAVGVTLV